MRYWHTLFLLNSIIISSFLLNTQVWAGEKVTRGSSWEIVGKIEVPSGKASIYFQDGKSLTSISSDKYAPWCRLTFNTRDKQKRVLDKGSFKITKVSNEEEQINEDTSNYYTKMVLTSSEVPDVTQINCGHWDFNWGEYLTASEMNRVMEGIMKLELKAEK